MTQNKQNQLNYVPLSKMIFFQTLAPEQHQSPLIEHFKSECMTLEKNESIKRQREQLIMETPPILSFHDEHQEKRFYESEANKHQQFCCGGMNPISVAFRNDIAFSPKDNYVFSPGNGKLYEGSQKMIDASIKQDIGKSSFGSPDQNALMTGLKTFNTTVSQRSQSTASVEIDAPVLSEMKSPNPFDMTLKPKGS